MGTKWGHLSLFFLFLHPLFLPPILGSRLDEKMKSDSELPGHPIPYEGNDVGGSCFHSNSGALLDR